jgi:hypothetical protein
MWLSTTSNTAGIDLRPYPQRFAYDQRLAAGGTVRSRPAGRAQNVQAVQRALEGAGVQFIPEIGGGAGVRLRKDFSRKNKG